MSDHGNMDTSPDTEEDTASGGPAEPADAGSPSDPAATDEDGTPIENPAG